MNITDVKIRKAYPEGKMRAIVSVTFDDMFAVHDIKVIEGKDKLFIAMPSRKGIAGDFRDIVHPINKKMRDTLERSVLYEYENFVERKQVN